jgi:hypothetical protein
MGAVLGHFIATKHVPKYSEHLQAGNYLVLRHQPQASDAQTLQQDTTPIEVDHHDDLITAPALPHTKSLLANSHAACRSCDSGAGATARGLPHRG